MTVGRDQSVGGRLAVSVICGVLAGGLTLLGLTARRNAVDKAHHAGVGPGEVRPEEPTSTLPPSSATPDASVAATAGDAATSTPGWRLDRKLNVVLVTIDTLRHDLGFSGYP